MALYPVQKKFIEKVVSDVKKFIHAGIDVSNPSKIDQWMIDNDACLYFLMGGAVSAGKSYLHISFLHQLCIDYPGTRWAIVRKSLKTLKRNSIPTYQKILQSQGDIQLCKINMQDFSSRYANGSELLFVEANQQSDPNYDKIYGLEVTGALFEEANQVEEKVFGVMITRCGRWNNNLYKIPPFILLNCNPSDGWVKERFYDKKMNGTIKPPYYFLETSSEDNKSNSATYLASLKNLPEAEYKRLVLNDWTYSTDPNALLRYENIKDCFVQTERGKQIWIGVDVARFGDDRSVLAYRSAQGIYKIKSVKGYDNVALGDLIINEMHSEGLNPKTDGRYVMVETTGVGAGVYDYLHSKKIYCLKFEGAERPTESPAKLQSFTFRNKRVESAWLFKTDLEDGDMLLVPDEGLKKECLALRYSIPDKVINLEAKDEMKKRLGFSPDIFDACGIANYCYHYSNLPLSESMISCTPIDKLFDSI